MGIKILQREQNETVWVKKKRGGNKMVKKIMLKYKNCGKKTIVGVLKNDIMKLTGIYSNLQNYNPEMNFQKDHKLIISAKDHIGRATEKIEELVERIEKYATNCHPRYKRG